MRLATIELDDDFQWVNEFDHNPIQQSIEYSLTGALLVQEGRMLQGRKIELRSNGGVWTPLSVVRQLEALRDQPSQPMELVLADGRELSVIWDRVGPPLSAEPILRETYPDQDSMYDVSMRFLAVG